MSRDITAELKKRHPKEWQLGFEKGHIAYEKGFKLGYRKYKNFTQICFESIAYNDGFIDGYLEASEEDVKLKTH